MLYGWKENSMLTNCLAACAHLTITVSEIERDICEKVVILSYPVAFNAPVREVPVGISAPLWYGKTRMVSLPDGEKISKISLFVLAQLTNVTDRQTDTAWQQRPRLCTASRSKKWNRYRVFQKKNTRSLIHHIFATLSNRVMSFHQNVQNLIHNTKKDTAGIWI